MELKEGYKRTEFGILPDDWNVKTFNEISYMKGRIGWQGLNQTEFTMNTFEPFLITGMNFKDGEIRWNEVYHISEERFEIAKEIQLKHCDVLMTKDGTIGKLLYVENIPYPYKASLNSHLLVFRPYKNSYNPKYLYYNLLSPYFLKHIELSKSGTTFFGISQTSVGEYKIILPPLSEQTAIATALSDVDALINSLEKLLTKKRNIKQGAMQKLLQPKEGWEVKTYGEIFDFLTTATYSRAELTESDNVKYVHYGDIHTRWNSFLDVERNSFPTVKNEQVKNYPLIKEGDIIMADASEDYAGIGKSVEVKNLGSTKIISGLHTFLLRDNKDVFINGFKGYIHSCKIVKEQFDRLATGLKVYGVSKSNLKTVQIPTPPKTEQARIATILSDMDAEIAAVETKLEKYRNIKLGMMQELLTGKIRLV